MTTTKQAGHVFRQRTTKKAQLIRILSGKASADIATISGKLGWQSHTTRAAITGLRKAGYEVAVEKPEGGRPTRYRVTAEPPPADEGAEATAALETVDAR
jgi:predicted ArsR family transcriptional regulator